MKNRKSVVAVGLLLTVGIMITLGIVTLRGLRSATGSLLAQAQPAQAAPAQSGAAQIAGDYSGVVKLDVTVGGVYSNTLATPPPPAAGTPAPPDLGTIDLSIQLSQTGNALSGYVNLDKTLVFSVEHTLGSGASSLKIGPYIQGTFDGSKLTLQSEQVALVVGGRQIQRQFRLSGVITQSDGSQWSGEYRETLWGYTLDPITVIGSFSLQRPVFTDTVPAASNQAPSTVADNATTAQGKAVTINVLANDSDSNGDALTIVSLSKPQFGSATSNGQSIVYTPNANFNGEDTFTYLVSDGKGGTTAGSITVVVGTGSSGGNNSVYLPVVTR